MSERYRRQIILPELGPAGQAAIRRGSVLVVGAGGLGCPASLYLAAAGVGRIGLIDPDRIDESNLQRQVLFDTASTGELKVDAAARRLRSLNPDVEVVAIPRVLDAVNALELFEEYDVIVDGTDNFATKFLINDAAVRTRKPVVYGSILGFEGQAAVFDSRHGACYRCLYPHPPQGHVPNCAEAGVLGALAGMIGSLQAMEAIKLLAEQAGKELHPLRNAILMLDARDMTSFRLTLKRDPSCPACSRPDDIQLESSDLACSSDVAMVNASECTAESHFIDCREHDEWRQGHIQGAINIPLSKLLDGHWPELDTTREWIVYCQSGIRSQQAAALLAEHGFTGLRQMSGGLEAWPGNLQRDD